MRYLLASLLLIATSLSWGAQTTTVTGPISFQPPTKWVDGRDVQDGDISGYSIFLGRTSGNFDVGRVDIPAGGGNTSTVNLPFVGEVSDGDVIYLYVALTAKDFQGGESDLSNIVRQPFEVSVTQTDLEPPVVVNVDLTITCEAGAGVVCNITATTGSSN